MKNNNKIYDLPKTETISYFNEVEWNKNLTPGEIAQSEQLADSIYKDGEVEKKIAENSEGVLPGCVRDYLNFAGDNAVNASSEVIETFYKK